MPTPGRSVLTKLRRLRRAVAGALVPALLSSVLAGAACPAMSAAAPISTHSAHTTPAAQHHEHAAREHHAHDGASVPAAQPSGDCPHCLGGHAAGNVATADCGVAAATAPNTTDALSATPIALPMASYEPLATSPVPPLIGPIAHASSAPTPSVPLHIRHCVLLI